MIKNKLLNILFPPRLESIHSHFESTRDFDELVLSGLACIMIFLLLNPFLAIFILSVISIRYRIPNIAFFSIVPVSFALFFYFREYGVAFTPDSTDDIPTYISLYHQDSVGSFSDIFTRFYEQLGGYEPLWHIIWWPVGAIFEAPNQVFLFLHYLLIFFGLFAALHALSKRYFILLTIGYLFVTFISIDTITFLWRQQLAFSMLVAGVGSYMVNDKKLGKWLIYFSPLMHLSSIFFVFIFVTFELFNKYIGLNNIIKLLCLIISNFILIFVLSTLSINVLVSIGLERLVSYQAGSDGNYMGLFVRMGIYSIGLLLVYLILKSDKANNFFVVVLFSVFSLILIMPSATGIYLRYLTFAFPLYSLFVFRALLLNFSSKFLLSVIMISFVYGVMRMHGLVQEGVGVVRYLGYGHPFDPYMGILKMLSMDMHY
jgi:hypothetical protein